MKKQALITGATSGIGHATALRLAALGYDIIATGRRAERLAALKSAIEAQGGSCRTLCFDVRSEAECRKHLEPLDRVDLLLNNAGLAAGLEHIDQGSTADWDAMIDTNVKGLLYVCLLYTSISCLSTNASIKLRVVKISPAISAITSPAYLVITS